jgi:hypothetical protein
MTKIVIFSQLELATHVVLIVLCFMPGYATPILYAGGIVLKTA